MCLKFAKIQLNPALHKNIPLTYIVNWKVSIWPTVAGLPLEYFNNRL